MREEEWLSIFSQNLEEMLIDANVTQRELADATGLSESTISKYLKGQQLPGVKAIINISYKLGCDLYDLIDFGSRIE